MEISECLHMHCNDVARVHHHINTRDWPFKAAMQGSVFTYVANSLDTGMQYRMWVDCSKSALIRTVSGAAYRVKSVIEGDVPDDFGWPLSGVTNVRDGMVAELRMLPVSDQPLLNYD